MESTGHSLRISSIISHYGHCKRLLCCFGWGGQAHKEGGSSLRLELAALQEDVNLKFNQLLSASDTQSAAIDELRHMFCSFLGKSRGKDHTTLPITHSTLNQQECGGVKIVDSDVLGAPGRKDVVGSPLRQSRQPTGEPRSPALVKGVGVTNKKEEDLKESELNEGVSKVQAPMENVVDEVAKAVSGGSAHSSSSNAGSESKVGPLDEEEGKEADVVQVAGLGAPEDSPPVRSKKATELGAAGAEGSTERNRSKANSPCKVKASCDLPQHASGEGACTS